jgi:hypothetical protein
VRDWRRVHRYLPLNWISPESGPKQEPKWPWLMAAEHRSD